MAKKNRKIRIGDRVSFKGELYFVKGIQQNGRRKLEYKLVKDYDDVKSIDGSGIFAAHDKVKPVKRFSVDVHWDVARSFEIEATSRREAVNLMWEKINGGDICVWTDGFEATDDVECECHGEENEKGEIEYD